MRSSPEAPEVRPGSSVLLRALAAGAGAGALLGLAALGAAPVSEIIGSLASGGSLSSSIAASTETTGPLLYGFVFAACFGALIGAGTAVVAAGAWLYTEHRRTARWPARLAAAVAAFLVVLGLAGVLGVGLGEPVGLLFALVGGALAYGCAPRVGYERTDRVRADRVRDGAPAAR